MINLNIDIPMLADLLAEEVAKQVTAKVMESLRPHLERLEAGKPQEATHAYLNRQELAQQLGISVSSVDRFTADETIPAVRIGKRVLYSEADVRAALDGARM